MDPGKNLTLDAFINNNNISSSPCDWNSCNVTTDLPEWKRQLFLFHRALIQLLLAIIMIAMGCAISLRDTWAHLKRPVDLCIGFASQFFLLPLMVFGEAHAFQLVPLEALALMIMGTCPGGTMSNMFTYWSDGDISLSVCMTTMSTILAIGLMPFNLWLYGRSWTSESAVIPYVNIVVSLASILGPALLGVLVRRWSDRAAGIVTMIGSVCAMLGTVVAIVCIFILYPAVFNVGLKTCAACALLPLCGGLLGFGLASVLRRNSAIRRTIAYETGSQNVPIAMSIITLSYSPYEVAVMTVVPIMFAFCQLAEGILASAIWRGWVRFTEKKSMTIGNETAAVADVTSPNKTVVSNEQFSHKL